MRVIKEKKPWTYMLTLPTDFALLGGKGNRINPRWRPILKTKGL